MKRNWICALVLAIGIASGLAAPRLLAATLAWAGGCNQGLCYVQTTNPTGVQVWIEDSQTNKLKLHATLQESSKAYFCAIER